MIDPIRLAVYKRGGFENCCVLCLGLFDDNELRSVALEAPAEYPTDLATIIAAFIRSNGQGRVCFTCEPLLTSGDLDRLTAFGIARLQSSPWFTSQTGQTQDGLGGLFVVVQYAYWKLRFPQGRAAPPLQFMIDLLRDYPMNPLPIATGPLEVFCRDVGLGCYLSAVPTISDAVLFHDFASREKGRGYGGIVFRKMLARADHARVPIIGFVEPHGKHGGRKNALSRGQLLRWYQKLGFYVTGALPIK